MAITDGRDQTYGACLRAGTVAWRRQAQSLALALLGVLVLAGCSSPTMLRASDFEQTYDVDHEARGGVPFSDWCSTIRTSDAEGVAASVFGLRGDGFTFVGAKLFEAEPGFTASDLMEDVVAGASACEDRAAETDFLWIEPLAGLPEGAVGWRNGENSVCPDSGAPLWGEFAAQAVDETHVLTVGFKTCSEDPPIEINELIRLGLEGAERVGLDD